VNEQADVVQSLAPGQDRIGKSERTAGATFGQLRIGAFRKAPAHFEALARVRDWTRERFDLAHDAVILVSEVACPKPGCPPLETFVAYWIENRRRYHFKVFKPVNEVVFDDLPPPWLKDALCATEGMDFECC
jgi:nitrate reductase delta subunit